MVARVAVALVATLVVGWLAPGQWYYWLGDTTLGMIAIITIHVWRMLPFSTVILLVTYVAVTTAVEATRTRIT